MSWPNTRIDPLVGSISPMIIPSVVVFQRHYRRASPSSNQRQARRERPDSDGSVIGLAEIFDHEGDVDVGRRLDMPIPTIATAVAASGVLWMVGLLRWRLPRSRDFGSVPALAGNPLSRTVGLSRESRISWARKAEILRMAPPASASPCFHGGTPFYEKPIARLPKL